MAVICHYALHKLKLLPSTILNLPEKERTFIIGSIKQKLEDDKKGKDRIQKKMPRRVRRM